MTIKELFESVGQGLPEDQCDMLFHLFWRDFQETLDRVNPASNNWQDFVLGPEQQEVAQQLYDQSCSILGELALRLANTTDDPVYKEAGRIAKLVREALSKETGAELPEVQFMSPSNMMVRQGLARFVTGPDGEKCVQLTAEGETAARQAQEGIKNNPGGK